MYDGPERRQQPHIDDEWLEHIAERVASKLIQRLTDTVAEQIEARAYQRIGKVVAEKILWAIGMFAVAAFVYLAAHEKVKLFD